MEHAKQRRKAMASQFGIRLEPAVEGKLKRLQAQYVEDALEDWQDENPDADPATSLDWEEELGDVLEEFYITVRKPMEELTENTVAPAPAPVPVPTSVPVPTPASAPAPAKAPAKRWATVQSPAEKKAAAAAADAANKPTPAPSIAATTKLPAPRTSPVAAKLPTPKVAAQAMSSGGSAVERAKAMRAASAAQRSGGAAPPPAPTPEAEAAPTPAPTPTAASLPSTTGNQAPDFNSIINHEIELLTECIKKIGSQGEGSKFVTTFGEIFKDEDLEQQLESLVGTLKAAKKRGIISFKGQLLLQGAHDAYEIKLLR
jgi:hypothetical protein